MTNRFWFYLAAGIVVVGLTSGYASAIGRQNRASAATDAQMKQNQYVAFDQYLSGQTDARKLLVLAKNLRSNDPVLLEKIADRAYELNPNARDVAIFASYFHPELVAKVKQIDPLYSETNLSVTQP